MLLAQSLAIGLILCPMVVGIFGADETNAPPKQISATGVITVTNNVVSFDGKMIGRIDGTNYVAVPDVKALNEAHGNGFALGVRYGAVATRRNPDVTDWTTLIGIAQQIMQTDQAQQQQQTKTKGRNEKVE